MKWKKQYTKKREIQRLQEIKSKKNNEISKTHGRKIQKLKKNGASEKLKKMEKLEKIIFFGEKVKKE